MDSAICWVPYIYPVDNAEIPYPLATIERACNSRWIALSSFWTTGTWGMDLSTV